VGQPGADATEAESIQNGVLIVRTRSSSWSHELTLHRARLLAGLNGMLGADLVTGIRFRAQGVAKKAPPAEEPDTPPPEELASVALEPEEKAELRAHLQDLFFAVEDDAVRRAIAGRLTTEARLRHWRLARGWHVCPRCTALNRTEHPLCPLCRFASGR
jgi:predicted nucleic acid-binding Zn ribbon protein